MDKDFLSAEAARLSKDVTLLEALSLIKANALAKLMSADPTNSSAIIEQQVRARLCDEITTELSAMIHSGQVRQQVRAV